MLDILFRFGKIPAAAFTAIIVICGLWSAAGEETPYITLNYTNDIEGYAAAVAGLNGATAAADASKRVPSNRGAPLVGVLVRTDGAALDPEKDGLKYCVAGPRHCYTLYYTSTDAATRAVAAHQGGRDIVYAELDGQVFAASIDGGDYRSWGAAAMGFADYADHCGRWGKGSAVIAIVDSGVSFHPMLADRMTESGYDYIDGDWDATNDLFGHGTHVAGIAADCTHGAPVSLYPIRVLDADGRGMTSNVINAIAEACERGVDVVNLSMASFLMSEALDMAIREAMSKDIIVVIAAGNGGSDTLYVSPAHLTDRGIVVVGSAEYQNGVPARAAYSNFGESVDLYAYGTDIVCCGLNGDFETATGTSMAAPHVSSLCALLRLLHPNLPPTDVEERLMAACRPGAEIGVPELIRMIPTDMGFDLRHVRLSAARTLTLPPMAEPETAMESLTYESGDPETVRVTDGTLVALKPGKTWVTATCQGLEPAAFEVEVLPFQTDRGAVLPISLVTLDDGAFRDDPGLQWVVVPDGVITIGNCVFDGCTALQTVRLPDSLSAIGDNTFSDAVLLCGPQSAALEFARLNGLQYVIQ